MAMIHSSWEHYRSVRTLFFLPCTFLAGVECACFISIDKFNLRNHKNLKSLGIVTLVNQT